MLFSWFRLSLVMAVVCLLGGSATTAAEFEILGSESKVTFVGKKTDGKHTGGFKKIAGSADVQEDPADSSLRLEIETASIYSDDDKLTNHLKSGDFFNVRQHPKIVFVSTDIEETGEGEANITGKLTLLGVVQEVTIPIKVTMDESVGKATLVAKFKIDRTKFKMNYGAGKIENEVEIEAKIVFQPKV